jgi:phosphoserine aminotransferase
VMRKSLVDSGSKNIAKIFAYRTYAENRSLYNTPPVFAIFTVGLVLKWVEEQGGLAAVEANNRQKAKILYDALDECLGVYEPAVTEKSDRSLMNVTWRLRNPDLEGALLAEAKKNHMDGLKGHRSVGGFRASIYNAFPTKGVQALADLLRDFAQKNG